MKRLCTLLAWLSSLICFGQPGALDPTWNGRGWRQESFRKISLIAPDVRQMFQDPGGDIVIQLDGGSPFSRHKANGVIDENYGYEGYAEPLNGNDTRGILLPDGRQLATALITGSNLVVGRYLSNGTLDPSFGNGGKSNLNLENVSANLGIIAQDDHKLLGVVVQSLYNTTYKKLTFIRLLSNGLLDGSFGTGGMKSIDIYDWQSDLTVLKMDAAGRLLIGGVHNTANGTDVLVTRFSINGQLDSSFGSNGRSIFNIGGNERIQAISLDPEQRILVASNLKAPDVPDHIALSRLSPHGSLDSSFGAEGHQKIQLPKGVYVDALAVGPNGIYLSGSYLQRVEEAWGGYDTFGLMVARFTHTGILDKGFGTNGFLLEPQPLMDYEPFERLKAPGLICLPSGKILVATREEGPLIEDSRSQLIKMSSYLPDGNPDLDFGIAGSTSNTYFTGFTQYNALALQADGKLVAAGTSVWDEVDPYDVSYDFIVARYHPNGTLDSSFGKNGKIFSPIGAYSSEFGEGILVQADQKILVAGQTRRHFDLPDDNLLLAMRYKPDGSLDETFGSVGVAYLTESFPTNHVPDPITGILQSGSGYLLGDAHYRLVSFRNNGTLDSSFGTNGMTQESIDPYIFTSRSYAFCLQSDDKVLMAGTPLQLGMQRPKQLMIRYQKDGKLDSSFGVKGIPQESAGLPELDAFTALALQPDGKIIAAGHKTIDATTTHLVLLRFLEDGTADTSFSGGHVLLPIQDRGIPKAIQIQADGKILVAVNRIYSPLYSPEKTEVLLYRYLPDGTPDAGFGTNGIFNYSIWNSPTSINAALLTEERLYTAGSNTFGARSTYGLITAHLMDSGPAGSGLNGFTLIDAITDKDLRGLHDNDTINIAAINGRQFSIRVNPGSTLPASVVMQLSGPYNRKQVENTAPFSLFGNAGSKYGGWKLTPGDYTLTATPYSATKGTGLAGKPITIHFRVIDSLTLSHFTLIDARTDKPLHTLNNGAVIDLSQTPAINISVAPGIGFIGSVRFGLNNQPDYRTENKAPYALAPNQPGRFTAWNIQPGAYTLTATPYGGRNGMGASGQPLTVHFRVIRSGQPPAQIAAASRPLTNEAEQGLVFTVLPNPVHTDARLLVRMPGTTTLFIALYDMQGRMVRKLFGGKVEAGVLYQHNLPAASLPPGTYLLQATDGKDYRYTLQFIKQ